MNKEIVKSLDDSLESSENGTYSVVEDKDEMFRIRNNTHFFSSIEISDEDELKELIELLKGLQG